MYSRLVSWSRFLYLAGIVLAVVLVIPTAWFPFQLAKLAVFSFILAAAVVMFVLGGGARELLKTHGFNLALLIAALPLSYLFSLLFSTDSSLALTGLGIETDTVVFVTLASLAFLFSFVLFRTLRMVKLLGTVVFWTLAAAVGFQAIVILFGTTLVPFQIFSDRSVNLIGKWNDLGIAAGLLLMFILVQAEMANNTKIRKIVLAVSAIAITILLGIINFALVWGFILAFSIAIAAIKFLSIRKAQPEGGMPTTTTLIKQGPWYAAAGVVFAMLFLFFGTSFNNGLTKTVTNITGASISSLEVRPSFSSTLDVIGKARNGSLGRALVGTGPNTFGESWLLHKPAEVNQSLFWNLDFNVGFSTFVTAFGTVGLVGLVAWLMPLLLVLLGIVRVIRLSVLSREEKIAATSIATGSLFLLASVLLYVPSASIIILSFVLSGATFGFLWRQGQSGTSEEETKPATKFQKIASLSTMVALVVFVAVVGFTIDRRFFAELATQQSQYTFGQGDIPKGMALVAKAQGIEKGRNNVRLEVDAGNLKLQQLASDTKTDPAALRTQFEETLKVTIDAGKDATTLYPTDYQQHLSFARVYDFLSSLKIQGAYESAKQYYIEAQKLNPNNPEIALALARLEAAKGNIQGSQEQITRALTLKPNYTDAILFVVQLNVANNDIPNAIRAATAAAQTAPGVAPIWFQLGLLYYAGGDTKNAVPALEKAIQIVPDYANAKYFLGLAYYAQKQTAEAQKQFEDLQKSNPDNAEINLILSNMKVGNQPFQAAQPPVSTNPVKRTTAPLP